MPLRLTQVPRHDARTEARRLITSLHEPHPRMPLHASLDWRAAELQHRLAHALPGVQVRVQGSVDSTNTRLLDEARSALRFEPTLLVAETQTAGRGRHGRTWRSSLERSLTFSLALPMQRTDLSGLSLAVGVALADALDAPGRTVGPRIGLKWPNDLWLVGAHADERPQAEDIRRPRPEGDEQSGKATFAHETEAGRKLGGVLIETAQRGAQRTVIVGVGLNVSPLDIADARSGVGSLSELDPHWSAPGVLHAVASPLALALVRFDDEGFAPFAARFVARDLLRGRAVSAGNVHGIADGIAAGGALRVRGTDGVQTIVSGEVSIDLRPALDAALPLRAC